MEFENLDDEPLFYASEVTGFEYPTSQSMFSRYNEGPTHSSPLIKEELFSDNSDMFSSAPPSEYTSYSMFQQDGPNYHFSNNNRNQNNSHRMHQFEVHQGIRPEGKNSGHAGPHEEPFISQYEGEHWSTMRVEMAPSEMIAEDAWQHNGRDRPFGKKVKHESLDSSLTNSPSFNLHRQQFQHQQQKYLKQRQQAQSHLSIHSNNNNNNGGHLALNQFQIRITEEPPSEVRTRTPSETRTFGFAGTVAGIRDWTEFYLTVSLWYGGSAQQEHQPIPKSNLLTGNSNVSLATGGGFSYESLSISESSTKHKEKEFSLRVALIRKSDAMELAHAFTHNFYSYSHKKVLERRSGVKIRCLNKDTGSVRGGEQMHVIGAPFIHGPSVDLIFQTEHGITSAHPLEHFSESVLFFSLPPYPLPEDLFLEKGVRLKAEVLFTNDGRTFSNALPFTYIYHGD